MRFLDIYFLDFVFRAVLGYLNQCNFKFFRRRPSMVAEIFTQPHNIKKLTAVLILKPVTLLEKVPSTGVSLSILRSIFFL